MVGSNGEIGWERYASLTGEAWVGRSFQSETLTHGLLWFTWDCHQESFNRPARKWEVFQSSCLCNMILEEINRESWYVCAHDCASVFTETRSLRSRWVCNKKVSKWMNHHQNSLEHDPGLFYSVCLQHPDPRLKTGAAQWQGVIRMHCRWIWRE